jgi:hypothetical protein
MHNFNISVYSETYQSAPSDFVATLSSTFDNCGGQSS